MPATQIGALPTNQAAQITTRSESGEEKVVLEWPKYPLQEGKSAAEALKADNE